MLLRNYKVVSRDIMGTNMDEYVEDGEVQEEERDDRIVGEKRYLEESLREREGERGLNGDSINKIVDLVREVNQKVNREIKEFRQTWERVGEEIQKVNGKWEKKVLQIEKKWEKEVRDMEECHQKEIREIKREMKEMGKVNNGKEKELRQGKEETEVEKNNRLIMLMYREMEE